MVENQKRSLVERVRGRIESRKVEGEGEQGSLILDILIGMAIFALIALIAVSQIGQWRARAYEQSAVSDAQSLGMSIEAAVTDANGKPLGLAQTGAEVAIVSGTETYETTVLSHDGKNEYQNWSGVNADYEFSFCVEHDGEEFAVYDSADGGIVERGREGGCPTP